GKPMRPRWAVKADWAGGMVRLGNDRATVGIGDRRLRMIAWAWDMQEKIAYQEREVVISNVQGLHARPVMRFVDLASQYQSKIRVKKDDMDGDGKSPMEMMILGATCGTRLVLCADGDDAPAALEALVKLIDEKFQED